MKKPEIPSNEGSRLATLVALNILDTPPEERFDRLTRLAKMTFDVPMALVSLVDSERQWFKSSVGVDVCEISRDISFCGHTILNHTALVVEDTYEDSRFSDNPLVTSNPKIRFYAGIPLKALNGERLGTFCVLDTKPRSFSENQLEGLLDIARIAERELSIVRLATVDDLTKVPNRRGFLAIAKNSLSFCNRHILPATLIYFDLNKFKAINDSYGHAIGDKVLLCFAKSVVGSIRETDTVGRLGGDEFVVILCDSNRLDAMHVITRIKRLLKEGEKKLEIPFNINFSYGIVEYDSHKHNSLKRLLEESDEKMYQQKRAKANIKLVQPS